MREVFREVSSWVDVFMFEDLNMSPARREILGVVREHFPEARGEVQEPVERVLARERGILGVWASGLSGP